MSPRRWFHLLLGAAFLPLLSLPLSWGVAIRWGRRPLDVQARRWARGILGLALIDTLVAVAGGVLVVGELGAAEALAPAAADRPAIGVSPDFTFGGPGARVQDVVPGGPAAAAGLQAGDVVIRVAGMEISGAEELRRAVGGLRPGVPVAFEVTRGSSTSTVEVTPQRSSRIPRRTAGFFEAVGRPEGCFPAASVLRLLPWAVILAAVAAVGVLVARRGSAGAAGGVWWTALSVVGAGVGSYAAQGGTCLALGGPSAAGGVSAVWGSSLALAGTALVARRFVRQEPPSSPTMTWGAAVAMGSWYLVTGALRLAVLLAAVLQLVPGQDVGASPVEPLAKALGGMRGPGLALLAVPVVLLGPAGEELAFRGLLQPALAGWLKPAAAVAVTSVLFASLHWYYGARLPMLVLLGAVLGWARMASGGLRAPIVLHMLVNAAGLLGVSWDR